MKIQEEDLIAKEAPYHNYCMTKYILRAERSSITLSTPVAGVSQEAFQKLVDEIKQNVIILGKAFTLSYLLKMLKKFNPNILDSYKSANLQRKLEKYFGDEITVLPQNGQGQSNFIFSSSVTLADAVKAASKAKSDTKRENPSIFTLPSSYEQSDDLILHQAVCIMRKEMAKLETDSDYPPPWECSIGDSSEHYVPERVRKIALWFVDKHSYEFNLYRTQMTYSVVLCHWLNILYIIVLEAACEEFTHTRHEKTLYLVGSGNGEEVLRITHTGIVKAHDLFSSHEEADSKIIFHAVSSDKVFAKSNRNGRIIINSPDTDVLVLAVHYYQYLTNTAKLWIHTGNVTTTADKRRYTPVHDISDPSARNGSHVGSLQVEKMSNMHNMG